MTSEPTVAESLNRMLTYYDTISLTGYPGSGKDTLAQELIERESEAGWVRLAYADALKQYAVDVGYCFESKHYETNWPADSVSELEEMKRSPEFQKGVREGLQRLGGETRKLNPKIWVEQLNKKWAPLRVPCVITDVRYPNEVKGLLVAVVRPGHDKVNDHESEVNTEDLISKADIVLLNDGTPEDLYVKLRLALHARSQQ